MLRFIPRSLLPMYGAAFFFSMFINILSLFSMWHFLLIIDRVIPGRNEATLIFITAAVLAALAMMALLEGVRARLLTRLSNRLEKIMAGTVVQAMLVRTADAEYDQGAADFQKIKNFLGGTGLVAFFDLPWLPLFLAVNYLLHPLLGIVSAIGAGVLLILLVFNNFLTKRAISEYSGSSPRSDSLLELAQRNVQTIYAMGMLPAMVGRWKQASAHDLALETRVNQRVGLSSATNKVVSSSLSIVLYSFGAMLVIDNQITFGMMIVASMIMSKALSPLGAMLGGWKGFQDARLAAERLRSALKRAQLPMIKPVGTTVAAASPGLVARDLSLVFDGRPVLDNVTFSVAPGQVLAVTGAGGAGKTTLLRTIAGLHIPSSGTVRLDGIDLIALDDRETRQKLLGYLPQDVELQAVTVAENIARLEADAPDAVIAAARLAGAHDMIMRLPKGYDTMVQPKAANLSSGQRQRIALARALYRTPRLVLLDEPDANLDEAGRKILADALNGLKDQGAVVLVVTHQPWIDTVKDQELNLD